MSNTRQAAVAGRFYPADPDQLARAVHNHLACGDASRPAPKAVIAPHAGYVYSGDVAGRAFAALATVSNTVHRVILIGPSHHVAFAGLAVSGADAFETPLGRVPVDTALRQQVTDEGLAHVVDDAHRAEHSLETHLPFLQAVLDDFQVLPITIGHVTGRQVADLLAMVWGGEETFISVSSDLSHFHPYDEARQIDERTRRAIEEFRAEDITHDDACGCTGIQGLLQVAERLGLTVETLDVRNSGDTAGRRDRVVGYGAWAFYDAETN